MKYIVEVAGRRLTVELEGAEVRVDGELLLATLETEPGSPVRLLRLQNAVHRVVARRDGARGSYRVGLDGWQFAVEALDVRTRAIRDLTAASRAASGPSPLLAPMPGLVVRVLADVGAEVVAGQPLVVVEAMKMENELRASAAGRITAVRTTAETAVQKGAILVELAAL